jgi:DNA-binding CsgD family transcriptional regulator
MRARVPFDGALFHELSPRAPLDRGALIGIDPMALVASSASWDENAVVLGRLRDVALAQDGVAIDDEAFPIGSRARREWDRRVRKPLGLRSAMVVHLEVRGRITAVILLGRNRSRFAVEDRQTIAKMRGVLAVCDALQQALHDGNVRGPAAQLECVDQRLTARQREIALQVALGHTNEEIGKALGISGHTVRNLLVQIRARLGAANRAEIVRVAVLR